MTNTQISLQAASARETARDRRGRFGEQPHLETGTHGQLDLPGSFDEVDHDRELLQATQKFAGEVAGRWAKGRVDAEDLAGDTMLYLMERRARAAQSASQAGVSNEPPKSVNWKNEFAGARVVAHHLAMGSATGNKHRNGPDIKGYEQFREICRVKTQQLKRNLSESERDAIADKVRLSFPAGRRPVKNFHRRVNEVRTASLVREDGSSLVENRRFAMIDEDPFERSEVSQDMDAVLEEVESDDRRAARRAAATARRQVYTMLARSADAPVPDEGRLTHEQADQIRQTVNSEGGAQNLLDHLKAGEETPATQAFMSIFSDDDPDAGEQVAEVMGAHRAYADDMVESAILYSTDPESERAA